MTSSTNKKLVSFDMDGTLIRNTNSMELVAGFNGDPDIAEQTFYRIKVEKTLNWVEGDYVTAAHMKGAVIENFDQWFETHAEIIGGLKELMEKLVENGFDIILVTSGPVDVAKCFKRRFPFNEVYGSIYEMENGIYTGNIEQHIMHNGGKFGCISRYCSEHGLDPKETIVIGDSYSDIEVFERCKKSIAINADEDLSGYAEACYKTENIMELLPEILKLSKIHACD